MNKPLLQVALDYTNLEDALNMIKQVESEVDIIEAGTPLIKSEGMKKLLSSFKELTVKPLVADLKVADVADIEFKVAKEFGAKYVTVLASSPIENIQDGLKSANELELELTADLLGVDNYVERSIELVNMGIKYIGLHCGISEQRQGKDIFSKTREVSKAITPLGGQIVVAGGIKLDNIDNLKGIDNIAIIISGGGITNAENPREAAKMLQEKISNL